MASDLSQDQIVREMAYFEGDLYWLPRGYGRFDKQFAGEKVGCVAEQGESERPVVVMSYRGKNYLLHRVIWIYHNGEIPHDMEIDHINTNSLDNRIENLRLATKAENKFNTVLRKDNKSGVKGVYWNKATNSWRARIQVGKKVIQVGMFDLLEEAAEAMSLAREKYHGAFANNGNEGYLK